MPITAQQFYDRAAIFSPTGLHPVSETRLQIFIDDAENRVARDLWGNVADVAVIYLAAHLLYQDVLINNTPIIRTEENASSGQITGAISSMSVGPVSVSYSESGFTSSGGGNAFSDESLATTPFGKKYIELRNERMLRGVW
jgi:hypothetical protein